MQIEDVFFIFKWWLIIFAVGISFLPLTTYIFSGFKDKGYIFSKVLGIGILSYIVFILGTFHILSFSRISVILIIAFLFVLNFIFVKKQKIHFGKFWKIAMFEEILFLGCLFLWAWVRSFQPSVHELEKFMDFGFINSILRSNFFPPKDMWFSPLSINYYYFGHVIIAVLTKLSDIKSSITFNLSVATIFAFSFVGSFSIGLNLFKKNRLQSFVNGFLTALIVTFAGNLQTIYAFFKPYFGENPTPFWQLQFLPNTFPNAYWYPNATRFIYHTIHEFPLYSFIVSDLHAHVLSIPFVLAIIAVLLSLTSKSKIENWKFKILNLLIISFLLSVLYMTNTWDTVTYFLLAALTIGYLQWKNRERTSNFLKNTFLSLLVLIAGTFLFTLPFSLNFKPFAFGIGVLCPPQFLVNLQKLGPFIFEADHCERSPIWQLLILYGFFFFWILSFLIFLKRTKEKITNNSDAFIIIIIVLSIFLIILPEFFYIKDIYSAHYRANTMFKFVYQSFIMLSISSAYIIARLTSSIKAQKLKVKLFAIPYALVSVCLLFLVFIYPYFSINSYYNGLKNYQGLDGTKYLQTLYPNDYKAIEWLNKNIKSQPVILEAQGDSYTDFARISANTGLPTVLGWTVHEWLWRGSYSVPAPRIADIQKLYESNITSPSEEFYTVQPGDYLIKIASEIKFGDWRNLFDLNKETINNPSLIYPNQRLKINKVTNDSVNESKLGDIKNLIKKYNISYIYVGDLERQKYPNLDEEKFLKIGTAVFQSATTKIYEINR